MHLIFAYANQEDNILFSLLKIACMRNLKFDRLQILYFKYAFSRHKISEFLF